MRTVEVPATTKQVCDDITCDICGRTGGKYDWQNGVEWAKGGWDHDEIRIIRRTGSAYPEGDFTTTRWFEICPACFEKHVVEHLTALKGVFYEQEAE